MKKTPDDLQPEYNFSRGQRGKYASLMAEAVAAAKPVRKRVVAT
jgi:hypothetical protein